jgi:hypothetical protein
MALTPHLLSLIQTPQNFSAMPSPVLEKEAWLLLLTLSQTKTQLEHYTFFFSSEFTYRTPMVIFKDYLVDYQVLFGPQKLVSLAW